MCLAWGLINHYIFVSCIFHNFMTVWLFVGYMLDEEFMNVEFQPIIVKIKFLPIIVYGKCSKISNTNKEGTP